MSTHAAATLDPLLSDESSRDPVPTVARLRRDDPVHWIPGLDAWFVTRHEDVRSLFADPRVTPDTRVYERYKTPPEGSATRWLSESPFISESGDPQTRGRRLVAAALTPRAVARMEGQVRDVVEQFAAPLRERSDVVDLVAEFTKLVPGTVISRVTGVPPKGDDEVRFRTLARKMVRGISPILTDKKRERTELAITEMCGYVRELVLDRQQQPREDLVSDLVGVNGLEAAASVDEIVKVIAGLVSTGTETADLAGTRALRTLLHHPDQLEMLRRDRSLLPDAVNELLRYDVGLPGMPRYALEEFELRGKPIRKGQLLVLSFVGAHRDPRVFSEPDELDLRRESKDLVVFGHGSHYCIGANLARTELRLMIDAALDFMPLGARLLDDEVRWSKRGMLSRIQTLPVDFGSRSA